MRCGLDGIPTVRFGTVFRNRKTYGAVQCCHISYGAVRCGFEKSETLQCGSVRFSEIVKPTMRFGAVFRCRERYGALRCYVMSNGPVRCYFPISSHLWCGAVRCGFQEGKNPTVRCGAVTRTEPHRTLVYCCARGVSFCRLVAAASGKKNKITCKESKAK